MADAQLLRKGCITGMVFIQINVFVTYKKLT